jgi:hypothetical protein
MARDGPQRHKKIPECIMKRPVYYILTLLILSSRPLATVREPCSSFEAFSVHGETKVSMKQE